jgi:hypothetical protein
MTNTPPPRSTFLLPMLLAFILVMFSVSIVAGLVFAGKAVADIVYLLAAIIPLTITQLFAAKKAVESSNKLDTVLQQTNGPIQHLSESVDALHRKVDGP